MPGVAPGGGGVGVGVGWELSTDDVSSDEPSPTASDAAAEHATLADTTRSPNSQPAFRMGLFITGAICNARHRCVSELGGKVLFSLD
jgi:hypothetical protein